MGTIETILVKSHPRSQPKERIDSLIQGPAFNTVGGIRWNSFGERVGVCISLSFDAVFELLRRKIVTIVVDAMGVLRAYDPLELRNIRFIRTSSELEDALDAFLRGQMSWMPEEEAEIEKWISSVFGRPNGSTYVESITSVLAEHG